jgi:two-component system, NtrC family, response regulator HydG
MPVTSELIDALNEFEEPRLLVRPDYTVAFANKAFVKRYGRSDYAGMTCHELLFHTPEKCSACGEKCPLEWSSVSGKTEEVLRRELSAGDVRYTELRSTPLKSTDGSVTFLLETVNDRSGTPSFSKTAGLVTESKAMKQLLSRVSRVAALDVPVLLVGPGGAGKKAVARLIHENSRRAAHSFLGLDCRTLTPEVIAAELKSSARGGLEGGTLYLSDVADLSAEMQRVVLKMLDTGRFSLPGDDKSERADIRLVCGSRRHLKTLLEEGMLNDKLYYRLAVCAIRVPGLDERREDLPQLCRIILNDLRLRGREVSLSPAAVSALRDRHWRDNVRELKAVLYRAALFCSGIVIEPQDLITEAEEPVGLADPQGDEAERLRRLVAQWQGTRDGLAANLGISVRTLYRLLKKYRIS